MPASPTPLTPSELTGDGRLRAVGLEATAARPRVGQRVVDERARHELAVLVVVDPLEQRLPDRVRDAAVDLAVDQHRVDRRAAVVDARRSARRRPCRSPRPRRRRRRARRTGRRSSPGRRTSSPRAPAPCPPAGSPARTPRRRSRPSVRPLSGEPLHRVLAVGAARCPRAPPRAGAPRSASPCRRPCWPTRRPTRRRRPASASRRCPARTGRCRCRRGCTSTCSGVDAEPVGHDLRERRVEALAVRRGAGVDGDRAGRVHADDRRLPEAGLQADAARADHARRRQAADLHRRWRSRCRGTCRSRAPPPARAGTRRGRGARAACRASRGSRRSRRRRRPPPRPGSPRPG